MGRKTAPLYEWQKSLKKDKQIRKENFIKTYYDELEFSKRYVDKDEVNELLDKYDINKDDLMEIVSKANDKFIESQKNELTSEFNSVISSFNRFIGDEDRINLRIRFNKYYFNFYDELDFDNLIDEENYLFIESEKSKRLHDLKVYLASCINFIDGNEYLRLKSKYNESYYSFFTELNMKELIDSRNKEISYEILKNSFNIEDEYISYSKSLEIQPKIDKSIDFNDFIDEVNESFIKNQKIINREFFENIDGKSLDDNQIRAVLTDDDNTQIVAGAGTGKTLTIQAKVKYLIEKQNVPPEDILCISFSNSARDDLFDKLEKTIDDAMVEVRTFHSLGYSILGYNDEYKEVPEYELVNLIDSYFKELLINKPELLKDIIEFFCYYYNIICIGDDNLKLETIKSRLTRLDEYDEYLKEYLQVSTVKRNREYMDDVRKLVVANYLFIHNIPYEYGKQAVFLDKNYDQYVSTYSKYLFGEVSCDIPDIVKYEFIKELDENFACEKFEFYPSFFLPNENIYIDLDSSDYNWEHTVSDDKKQKIEDKLKKMNKLNEKYKTQLLTILNHENDIDGLLFDVENNLLEKGILIKDVDYEYLFDLLISQDNLLEYRRFLNTVDRFINLFKGNAKNIDYDGKDISESEFKKYLAINHNNYSYSIEKRNKFYLNIIEKIYLVYKDYLEDSDYIDFNDMINDAVIQLRNGAFIHNYKYVLVDEYQDTSFTRYALLKEIQNVTGAKVVVVGDDWQSIFGFTGCNVNLFSKFDNYFDHPKMVKINVTRRNSQKLIDVVGDFILKNHNQIPKKLLSEKIENKKPIKIFEYNSRAEEVLALINILNNISEENSSADVLILGRNNNDIYEISCSEIFEMTPFQDYTRIDYAFKPNLKIEFRTVHKSKGLQRDYVVVLNLNNQINGFPNKIVNDSILDFVIDKEDEGIDYPEERRLFYVALTRTQNDVYLFTKSSRKSQFVTEIMNKDGVESLNFVFSNDEIIMINLLLKKKYDVIETDNICPKCGVGQINLILNNEKGTSYFRCSNFCGWNGGPYHNSDYSSDNQRKLSYVKYSRVCSDCNHMLIVRKNPSDGRYFLGCNMYKRNDPSTWHETISLHDFKESDELFLNVFNIKKDDLNKTRNGVYYLNKYIPVERYDEYVNDERIDFSKQILDFKDNKGYSVLLLTKDLMKIICYLSNNVINGNTNKLALIAAPPSKVKKIKKSSMRKSIDFIVKSFDDGKLKKEYGCNKEIINCKDLIKRVIDVPTAHLGEGRSSPEEHIDSMECCENSLSNENIAYVILDDITTTGNTMKACNQILLNNGADGKNIYNVVLGATVRDDDEEI